MTEPGTIGETPSAGTRLEAILGSLERAAVAVSGGVDSMLLAHFSHRTLGAGAAMYHAVSPAVPPEATERARRHAIRHGWALHVIDAGEFADSRYLANPVNRCFFCKANLYRTIAAATDAPILSGANLDDLGDYRPGLSAAARYRVRHPLVEAGIDKATVRRLAAAEGLTDLARLPSSPCLSSRLTTGIPVSPNRLKLVHAVERLLRTRIEGARTVRCRVVPGGIEIQLDDPTLGRLGAGERRAIASEIGTRCQTDGLGGSIRFAPYVMGSAFLKEETNGS